MEFPHIGEHCSVTTCHRLDFLPMKCDSCAAILCKDHIKYDEHQCPLAHRKNVQVPICPLCNQAVPLQHRDQPPDHAVSDHIDRDCKSDPAMKKRRKIYSNKCSFNSCKQREAIQVNCNKCLKTFCLKHRFPDDHKCGGFENTGRVMNLAGAAALERMKKTNVNDTNKNSSSNSKPTNDDDDEESIALAIKLSLNQTTQEENDFLLAKALQESEQEEARARRSTGITTKG
ncbi:unnamed protein product [Rotaria magnacalcarata]|uniref:AN1-type domain-containing protein n=7 Tax=Rotaria magnacalcarata TaxID=392030 RepID=A0A819U9Y0_9BILA|nr:unnamed protein product [Rotaria magnacalcarata]CAF1319240.1 unnamed protein product [Rotaria magnacalcarata]CAF2044452.1 unnamed protein product [Rotaria magnacalcarata]CAF2245008.1 unnamed protein product [Rotaria magnacalcarata]CAF2267624.1 unnamed protein product [Rotaria magnacalcarata]